MKYRNAIHKRLYENQIMNNPNRCSNEYLAAVYLLSAGANLWKASMPAISNKRIDFKQIQPLRLSPYEYSLIAFAKDIYTGTSHLVIKDLCDRYLIPDRQFKLILTAINICRSGYAIIGIEKEKN